MTAQAHDDLKKRKEAIKQEISTLDHAIADIDAGSASSSGDKLQKLRSALETRKDELREVEAQLAQNS